MPQKGNRKQRICRYGAQEGSKSSREAIGDAKNHTRQVSVQDKMVERKRPHFNIVRSFFCFWAGEPILEATSCEMAVWIPAPYMVKQIP